MNITDDQTFNSSNIKKYWKNQKPKLTPGEKFTDPYFPPNKNSLLALDNNGNFIDPVIGPKKASSIDPEAFEWKRAPEIIKDLLLFESKIECDDINQGSIGNCYFLAALAALTEYPMLIYQIFRTKEINQEGYYEVVLFIDGEWQIVFVDDYFPIKKDSSQFHFARPNGSELWVILLEKIWAKVNGGYINTITGWPSDPLLALTGFPTQKITHQNDNELWKALCEADKSDQLLCSTTKQDESIAEVGLVTLHVYTVISAIELIDGDKVIRLLKIRNPWGYREWNGGWSDKSPLWTNDYKLFFNHSTEKDDGTFFMCFEDFKKYFLCSHSVHLMYDCNIKTIEISEYDLLDPQVFNLYLEEESKISFSALFKHWRYNRDLSEALHPCSIIIASYDMNYNITNVDGEFSSTENVDIIKILKPGYYVIWVYVNLDLCTIEKPEIIHLRISSQSQFSIKRNNNDNNFKFLKHLMISGVKEIFSEECKKDFFTTIENTFKNSGFGYRIVLNNREDTHQKWELTDNGMENFVFLPPYNGQKVLNFEVGPMESEIVIAMRTSTYGRYWFNVKGSYTTKSLKIDSKNNAAADHQTKLMLNPENYLSFDCATIDTYTNYYDYKSASLALSKNILKFKSINLDDENSIENLKTKYPFLMTEILKLDPHPENSVITGWCKFQYNNGYYVGEVMNNNKHGRGAYFWNNFGTYVGYWTKGVREIFGRYFDLNNFCNYEGEMLNGEKSGKGTIFFKNGDRYTGSISKGVRDGPGVYYWANGCYWSGGCKNNSLHGTGDYVDTKGNKRIVQFENNSCVS